jgi:hypothetical protein
MESNEIHVPDAEPTPPVASPTQYIDGTLPASKSSRFDPKEFMTQLTQDVQETIRSRFRNLQGTIHSQIRNLQDNMVNLRLAPRANAEELRHRRMYHYNHSDLHIRSMRKLFDVIEQHYSWVSILLLLANVGLESAAFGIYLTAQHAHVPTHWLQFDWGMGYFIAEVMLSVFFMSAWVALLAVESKKMAYAFNVRSLMSHLSAGWMLVLAIGAVCSQNKAWTRVYAPMFLRIWWLHEALVTLLSYPQISVCFAENRLEMLRSMIQCIAVIGISVGILQAVESFCGNPIEYFDMVYMMLLAFSTIGYGDIVPLTVEGRLLMIVFIGVGLSYFVPILEYVADLGVRQLSYAHYTNWFKRSDHIVICGNLGYNEIRMQLKNILADDRHYLNMNVVLLVSDQPSAQVELLLNSPKYRSAVHLLVGDPSNTMDLDRCNARGASALFLYGAGTNSSYYSDYDVAKQAMSAHLHIPQVPLYVLLHRSRYTKSLMPTSANVLEFERLSHNLLGLGCVLPGMIPFLANLIRMFDPMTTESLWELRDFKDLIGLSGGAASLKALRKVWAKKRDMLTYGATSIELSDGTEPNWMSTYEASLAQHMDTVDAPEVVRRGHYTFISLARLLYRTGMTLLGVGRPAPDTWNTRSDTIVELGTRNSLVGVSKLIVICDVRRKAQDIVDEIVLDALTNPSTAGTPAEKHHKKHKGKRKSSATASPLPPPPADLAASNVTVVDLTATEEGEAAAAAAGAGGGDVVVKPSLYPDALRDSGSTPTTKGVSSPSSPSTAAVVMRSKKEVSSVVMAGTAASHSSATAPQTSWQHTETAKAVDGVTDGNSGKGNVSSHPHPLTPSPPSASSSSAKAVSVVAPVAATVTAAVASPTDPLRTPRANSRRDLAVPLSSTAANLALAAAEDDDDVPTEPIPSPTSAQHPSTHGGDTLPKISSVASITSSMRSVTPVSAQGKVLPSCTTTSSPYAQQQQQQPQPQPQQPPRGRQLSISAGSAGTEDRLPYPAEEGLSNYMASPAGLVSGTNTVLIFESNVMHLSRHYVFIDLSSAHERTNWSREAAVESRTAKAADYYDAMRPVRQHDPESNIVLLSNDTNYDNLNNLWEDEDVTGSLIVVQGCGLFTSDLRRCNVAQAAAVVIFSAGDRCDEHGDSLSVLVVHLVRQLIDEEKSNGSADVPIVVEVDHAELVPFFSTSYMTTGKNAQTSSEWVSEPSFMSGCVVCRHMLDTGLQEMYFTPLLHEVLEQILSSKSESLLVTVMAPDEAWRTYEDATNFGLENDLLPMAIHRFHEMIGENTVSFRYIITNPPPTFPLHQDDFIYCLKL